MANDPVRTTCITGSTSNDKKWKVPYNVWCGPGDIKRSGGPSTATTTVLCDIAWADSQHFITDMMGYSKKVDGSLQRSLPEKCPYDPKQFAMSYHSFQQTGIDPAAIGKFSGYPEFSKVGAVVKADGTLGMGDTGRAIYQIDFAVPLYDVLEDADVTGEYQRYVNWNNFKGSTQSEKIPGAGFHFTDNPNQILSEVGIKTGRVAYLEAKWVDCPFIDLFTLTTLSNKINSTTLVWGGTIYQPGTVLFLTFSSVPRTNGLSIKTYDITLQWAVRTDGRTWNKFWRLNRATNAVDFQTVVDGAGNSPYDSADLNGIFVFSA